MRIKQRITTEQLKTLSGVAQARLANWLANSIEHDSDLVHVFIPEEEQGPSHGILSGAWDSEFEFDYPDERIGKLKNHEGTILPLMDIGQMLQFLEDHAVLSTALSYDASKMCDALWHRCRDVLESNEVSES